MDYLVTREITAGQEWQGCQVSRESGGSADYMDCQAPKASPAPQVLTFLENQGSQAPLETGVTEENPTPFQALWDLQGRKERGEPQGNAAQPEVQDFRDFPASLRHRT